MRRSCETIIQKAVSSARQKIKKINSLYFDSKKSLGLTKENGQRQLVKQNLYVLCHGKKAEFLGSEVSDGENAKDGFELLKHGCLKRNLNIEDIFLIGSDGTNSNTGKNGGIIRLLEVKDTIISNIKFSYFI